MIIPLCGPSYESESANVDCQRTANWYTEKVESGDGASAMAMYPTPGLEPFATIAGASVRGLYEINGRTFGVGSNFAEIMADGSVVGYGFLPADTAPVSMAANNANQLIICTAGQLWLFPLASGAIIYTGVTSNIATIQIVDNGDPAVKDYYVDCTILAGYAVGSSVLFAGLTEAAFLNGLSGTILGIAGSTVHLQLARSLTLGYQQAITNAVLTANAAVNTSNPPTTGASSGSPAWQYPARSGSLTSYAYYNANPGVTFGGPYCRTSGYGFSIPNGAAIVGIFVQFDTEVDDFGNLSANSNGIALFKAGVLSGTPKTNVSNWGGTWGTETYGGSSDLWGTTWLWSDINDPLFGPGVQAYFDNADSIVHQGRIQKMSVTVYYTTFNATLTLSQTCVYTAAGEPIACAGLTHATALNGNIYPQISAAGSVLVIGPCPGPAYSGAETGTVTGEIVNYGPSADTGTIAGTVISYTVNPVQVAVGQGPFSEVDFVDGKFIARISNSQEFQTSGFEDGTAWDPADIYRVSVYADNNVAMIVSHKEIIFFGSKKSIPYYDSGDLLNQFQPRIDSLIENGSGAEYSVVRLDNSVFWIGQDERGHGIAWRLNGYSPLRVSNFAVENAWQKYPKISDAIAYSYQANGHAFWQIWFPEANKTWVYDAAQGEWHERFFLDNGAEKAHRSRCHSFSFGKHLVGDRSSGAIYSMDIAHPYDNVYGAPNAPIKSLRRTPHLQKEKQWMFHKMLQIDLQTGTGGPVSVSAGVPAVFLRDTNGATWALTVNALGILQTTVTSNAYQSVIVLMDAITGLFYTLQISTSGNIVLQPVLSPADYQMSVGLVDPTGVEWLMTVQNGFLQTGLPSALQSAPQIAIRWSDTSARTWSNYYFFSVGYISEYQQRVIRWMLGRTRDRVYEISTNDHEAKYIVGGYVQATL